MNKPRDTSDPGSALSLRAAFATIHADPRWLPKVLLHGLLGISVIGTPWAAGWVVESLDNTRKGFPTPLPPWMDASTRWLIGAFALLIDLAWFGLPLAAIGLLTICVSVGLVTSGVLNDSALQLLYGIAGGGAALLLLVIFLSGIAPLARFRYIGDGALEESLSLAPLRDSLGSPERNLYLKARFRSLPAYLPALIAAGMLVAVLLSNFSGQLFVIWIVAWLTSSALIYGQLAVVQIYIATEREAEERRFERVSRAKQRPSE